MQCQPLLLLCSIASIPASPPPSAYLQFFLLAAISFNDPIQLCVCIREILLVTVLAAELLELVDFLYYSIVLKNNCDRFADEHKLFLEPDSKLPSILKAEPIIVF